MGVIFDASCLVWQTKCDVTGACWVYESRDLAVGLTLTGVLIKTVSTICFGLAAYFYKPPPGSQEYEDIVKMEAEQKSQDGEILAETRL